MDISDEESDICTQDEYKCVNEMVKGILILDHSKKPFKQSEIKQFLSKKPSTKLMNFMMEKAKAKLKNMGLTLVAIKDSSPKSYILISSFLPLPSMYRYAPDKEVADRILLILVLTYIFMKEGSVTDVDIFNHLKDLSIYSEESPNHNYFGDIKKKILTEYVSQLYLEKIINKEAETCEIKWGERATAEVSKKLILEFVCNIGYEGTIEPKNLTSQYKIVFEEEQTANSLNDQENMVMVE